MSQKKVKQQRKTDQFNLLLTMFIMQNDQLYSALSDLQRKKKEGLISANFVREEIRRIAGEIIGKLESRSDLGN